MTRDEVDAAEGMQVRDTRHRLLVHIRWRGNDHDTHQGRPVGADEAVVVTAEDGWGQRGEYTVPISDLAPIPPRP